MGRRAAQIPRQSSSTYKFCKFFLQSWVLSVCFVSNKDWHTPFQHSGPPFFLNEPLLISNFSALPGISDHEIVVASITCQTKVTQGHPPPPRKVCLYSKGNYEGLSNVLFECLPEFQDVVLQLDIVFVMSIQR